MLACRVLCLYRLDNTLINIFAPIRLPYPPGYLGLVC
jgi:hypothetical protein